MRSLRVKRVFDLAVALPALIVTAPIQLVVALLVARHLGRPVLFIQVRPGLGGRPFRMVKFRSMRAVDPGRGLVDDESRMTPFGARLRKTSLDELPTLINVVRGDMSLVGPRPLLMQYLERYTPHQARRHEVRPGLTGLAQISGRNDIDWERKLALDVEYVDCRDFALDLRILAASVLMVLKGTGVQADGHVTAFEFQGSVSPARTAAMSPTGDRS